MIASLRKKSSFEWLANQKAVFWNLCPVHLILEWIEYYQNCRQTLDVYLLFIFCWRKLNQTRLQTCNLQTGQSITYKYVNQFWLNLPHPNSKKTVKVWQKFRCKNFDVQHRLEQFKYEMNRILDSFSRTDTMREADF